MEKEKQVVEKTEHEKAKECVEFLRNYCKADGSNCTKECPFAYYDWDLHCNLGRREPLYPCEWGTEQKEWVKSV